MYISPKTYYHVSYDIYLINQEWMSWTGCMTFTSALWAYNNLTTISEYHLSMNATVIQQSTPISVKKTHSLWHAWDVMLSSLSLSPQSECLSTHSVFNIRAVITWCIHFTRMHTVPASRRHCICLHGFLPYRWKSSISAALFMKKQRRFIKRAPSLAHHWGYAQGGMLSWVRTQDIV